jgi:hypothetical protein
VNYKLHTYLGLIALILGLASCASIESPKSINERLAYAYGSVAASRNTAASMLERGRITKAEGKQAQTLADQARTSLDLARAMLAKGDTQGAQNNLQLALDVLIGLETFLKGKS